MFDQNSMFEILSDNIIMFLHKVDENGLIWGNCTRSMYHIYSDIQIKYKHIQSSNFIFKNTFQNN